ncbi:ankyrin repeat domain-containing protein [Salsipaludibacter albus]|uniref:ankyrin repeat domain-containing protein n=1 Tax=Salsipaludibacter albus TaxID=2849650 RepID=UPI001EE46FFA|nr:ankyrin repeat domain-containing protein [Salsipaludibacter albus]MBY5162697.1 ankyrin repeat domain-containing protein [Salsipaludibacter albus]
MGATDAAALRQAVIDGDRGTLLRAFEEDPGAPRATVPGEVSLLLTALYHGRPRLAGDVAAAMDVADLDLDVLEAAAMGDQARVAAIVADDPAALGARTVDGFTPLHLAAFLGRTGVTILLVHLGADIETIADNDSQVRPLHSAVASGDPATVTALVDAGATVDVRQAGGFTPLMGAAAGGQPVMIERLLAAGARRGTTDDDGRTAARHAEDAGNHGLVDLLGG